MRRVVLVAGAATALAGVTIALTRSRVDWQERLSFVIEKGEVNPNGAAEGRPGRFVHHGWLLRRVANPLMVALGNCAVLFVRGRKSGTRLAVPMDPPFEWQGTRYLVSPLGDTHWARNLRAAGAGELRIHRHLEAFRAVELRGAERDAIVTAYGNTITCGCQEYLRKLPDPADHPVFRLVPLTSAD